MPYLELPGKDVSLFYLINPVNEKPLPYGSSSEPESGPLDPSKPSLLLLWSCDSGDELIMRHLYRCRVSASHAATACSAAFHPQFRDPRLQEAFNLISFDNVLHGRTRGPTVEKWTLRDSFECLLLAIDLLPEIGNFSIAGEAGHGTFLATLLAAKRSERVESVILISVGNFAEIEDRVSWQDWAEHAVSNKGSNGDGTGRIPEKTIRYLDKLFFGKEDRNQVRREFFLAAFQARYGENHSKHDLYHIGKFGTNDDMPTEEEYLAVTAPVLILQGDRKGIASNLASASDAAAAFKNAPSEPEVSIISGGRYLILFSDFSVTNRIILKFITRHRQLRRSSESSLESSGGDGSGGSE